MIKIKKIIRVVSFGTADYFFHQLLSIITKLKISKMLSKKSDKPIQLEIGAGRRKAVNGWITLDLNSKCNLHWDLRKGIPFPDESIQTIYSSHMFEHLTFKEINVLIKECLRVLKKNGVFSICVPNARIYIDAYINNNESFWNTLPSIYKPAYNNISKIDYVNYIAYMDGKHKYMFDEDNLQGILKLNGLSNVHMRSFNPDIDLFERNYESIYAEGTK